MTDPETTRSAHGGHERAGVAHGEAPGPGDLPPAERPFRRRSRAERIAHALPAWMGSVRFRLTAIYSLVLFGLAALVVAGLYLAVANQLHSHPVSRNYDVTQVMPNGEIVSGRLVAVDVERLANQRALDTLRTYSFTALSLLFLASLAVGWIVAGRVLAPISRITAVARDIQVTDLSRRISMAGPPDELKGLADTFDAMLGRLDDAFEGQRRFIHEASHELRNPLAVIRTTLDVVASDPEASTEDLRQATGVVRRSAERMTRLVDDLLAYADRGSPAHTVESLDVATVVHDAAAEFLVPANARKIRLMASARPGLWVLGDRDALRRALANLLANAVRLAPEGSEIRVAGDRDGDWVWMAVDDEGPGVPPERRESVFHRFWRGDERAAREEGRSGLGLAIVRQVAEAHRGAVRLLESPRGGSTFVVWLPLAPEPSAPIMPEQEPG